MRARTITASSRMGTAPFSCAAWRRGFQVRQILRQSPPDRRAWIRGVGILMARTATGTRAMSSAIRSDDSTQILRRRRGSTVPVYKRTALERRRRIRWIRHRRRLAWIPGARYRASSGTMSCAIAHRSGSRLSRIWGYATGSSSRTRFRPARRREPVDEREERPCGVQAVHVVATLNLTRGTGHLQHVTPVPAIPAEQQPTRSASRRSGRSTASQQTSRCGSMAARPPDRRSASDLHTGCVSGPWRPCDRRDRHVPYRRRRSDPAGIVAEWRGCRYLPAGGAAPGRAEYPRRDSHPAGGARGARATSADEVVGNPVITWSEPGGRARTDARVPCRRRPDLHRSSQHRRRQHLADDGIRLTRATCRDRSGGAWRNRRRAGEDHEHGRLQERQLAAEVQGRRSRVTEIAGRVEGADIRCSHGNSEPAQFHSGRGGCGGSGALRHPAPG